MIATILFILSVSCIYAVKSAPESAALVTPTQHTVAQQCFGCICEASSRCDLKIGCHDGVCGPFGITWYYWADSGKPTLNNDNSESSTAYANCVNNITCAAKTVQGYIDRYAQDCNGDGVIDCDDYARIHRLGGFGCSGIIDPKYMETYQSCKQYVNNQL